jgi:hypothetical protein
MESRPSMRKNEGIQIGCVRCNLAKLLLTPTQRLHPFLLEFLARSQPVAKLEILACSEYQQFLVSLRFERATQNPVSQQT